MSSKGAPVACFVCERQEVPLTRHGDIWLCLKDEAEADAILLGETGVPYQQDVMTAEEIAQEAQG